MGRLLELVSRFDHQVTGVAVARDGRRFVCFPRWTDDAPVSVAELDARGRPIVYPDRTWNSWRNQTSAAPDAGERFVCAQAVFCDRQDRLWVVDAGAPGHGDTVPGGPKIVAVDLATDMVSAVHVLPEQVAPQGSYLNDIRVSPDGRWGYLTDSGARGAIVVVDLESGLAVRCLDGHASTQPESGVTVTVRGRPLVRRDGRRKVSGSDGIALSHDGRTLYYQSLTGTTLYAVPTRALALRESHATQDAAVRRRATTAVADGLLLTGGGRLLLTSPTDASVREVVGDSTRVVLSDRRLCWPDTLAEGPGCSVYLTDSRIPRSAWYRRRAPDSLPTALYRFTLPGADAGRAGSPAPDQPEERSTNE